MPDAISTDLFVLLFAAGRPTPAATLAEALDISEAEVRHGVRFLEQRLAFLGLTINERKGGFELVTHPERADLIRRFKKLRPPRLLSQAAKETLIVIMRRGPITRRAIQEIRKVADVSPVLRTLRAEGLIAKAGHLDSIGNPLLYRATAKARERFPDIQALVREMVG